MGLSLGGVGGLGFTGEKVEQGWSKRLDRMISLVSTRTGRRLFHPTTPELRVKDQDLDGVEAEVIYGILGVGLNLKDPEAMSLVYRIYNDWAADFCRSNPERFRALACIPNHDLRRASELRRASGLGCGGRTLRWPRRASRCTTRTGTCYGKQRRRPRPRYPFTRRGSRPGCRTLKTQKNTRDVTGQCGSQCSSYRGRSTWPASYSRGRATGTRGLDSCWARAG